MEHQSFSEVNRKDDKISVALALPLVDIGGSKDFSHINSRWLKQLVRLHLAIEPLSNAISTHKAFKCEGSLSLQVTYSA